jgi:hypothetical protein
MAHYAKVNPTDDSTKFIVQEVIVADESFVNTLPGLWKQTSYNTKGNVHVGADGLPDGGQPLRGNYAGIGFTYDAVNDVFYGPSPYTSWVLDTNTWTWNAPIPYPNDGKLYMWNEPTYSWIEFSPPSEE